MLDCLKISLVGWLVGCSGELFCVNFCSLYRKSEKIDTKKFTFPSELRLREEIFPDTLLNPSAKIYRCE